MGERGQVQRRAYDSRVTDLQIKLRWPGPCNQKNFTYSLGYSWSCFSSSTAPIHTRLSNFIGVCGQSLDPVLVTRCGKGHSASVINMKDLKRRT